MQPKRIKKPARLQFNVRIGKDVFARANIYRVRAKLTWPELIEQVLEQWSEMEMHGIGQIDIPPKEAD